MKKLVIAALLFALPAMAIETDKAAHLGTSYALQTFTYGMAHKAFKMDKIDSIVFSTVTVFMVGFTKEMLDGGKTRKVDLGDIGANAAGQALSIGTILMFDF